MTSDLWLLEKQQTKAILFSEIMQSFSQDENYSQLWKILAQPPLPSKTWDGFSQIKEAVRDEITKYPLHKLAHDKQQNKA